MPRKKIRPPTPIKPELGVDPIMKIAGGSVDDQPVDDSSRDESLANQLWVELEDEHGEVEVGKIPNGYLQELRRRVRDGELQTRMITGDDAEAADKWTRTEVGRLFIRYRRQVSRYKIREFVPVLHDQPTDRKEWVRGSARPDAAARHAANSLTNSIDTSIRLHGAALVALGVAEWGDVENYAIRRVQQQCAGMRDRQGLQIVPPKAASGGK